MKSRLSRISTLPRTLASPTLFLFSKALGFQRQTEQAVRMDPINLLAMPSLALGRQLKIENLVIAAPFTVAEAYGVHRLLAGIVASLFPQYILNARARQAQSILPRTTRWIVPYMAATLAIVALYIATMALMVAG